jgi:hypothetical protein
MRTRLMAIIVSLLLPLAVTGLPVRAAVTYSIPHVAGVHLWPGLAQLDPRSPLSFGPSCMSLQLPDSADAPIETCAVFDDEELYIRFTRSTGPAIDTITIKPTPDNLKTGGYNFAPPKLRAAPRAWHDPLSWESGDAVSAVHDCSDKVYAWCQMMFIPLSDLVTDPEHQIATTFAMQTGVTIANNAANGTAVSATADFSHSAVTLYPDQAKGRIGYAEHIGPPPVVVTPNPVPAGYTPPPAAPPISRRAEAQAHAFIPGAPALALGHLSLDGIVGQSTLISSPDRSTILNLVQPSSLLSNFLGSIIDCLDCAEYRHTMSGVLQRRQFADLVSKKVDVSQLGVDDLLYDASTSLGPFDSSITISRSESAKQSFRYGISQFHGSAGSFNFNDVVGHFGVEMQHGDQELDVYGTHVAANHGSGRTIDAGAVIHYADAISKTHFLAEYDSEIPSAQRKVAMLGITGSKSAGERPWKFELYGGWTDSDVSFSPLDGTTDPLFGTRGPLVTAHVERDGNAHGTGRITVDAFARRAFDATTVRRSNVGVTAAYGLSHLFSLSASMFNRPSAGSVVYAEAGQPFTVPSPAPAAFNRFLDDHYQDSRSSLSLKYSDAAVSGDRFEFERGIFEASLGLANSRTSCLIRDQFSCAALPPNQLGVTGSVYWLTRGRQFFAVNHNTVANPHVVPDATHSSAAVNDGYLVASALGRCGSAYFGSQNAFGNGDPTKNGRTILGSVVLPLVVAANGSSSALRIEYKHRSPLVLASNNVPTNALNVQLVVGTPNYYGAPDVTRCNAPATPGRMRGPAPRD